MKMARWLGLVVVLGLVGNAFALNTNDINQPYDPDANTLGLWHFDEAINVPADNTEYTSVDASGLANDAKLKSESAAYVNTFSLTEKKFGASAMTVAWQRGSRWYVRVPESASLVNGTALTAEGWFYITGDTDPANIRDGYVLRKGEKTYHEWSLMFTAGADETQRFLRATVSTTDNSADNRYVTSNVSLASIKNQWVHLAMTYDGRALEILVNGQSVASQIYATSIPIYNANSAEVNYVHFMGFGEQGLDYTLTGYVDEVRVSNVVRTFPLNGGNTDNFTQPYDPDAATVGLWHFDDYKTVVEGQVFNADDHSASNNLVQISNYAVAPTYVYWDNVTKKFGTSSLYSFQQRDARNRWARVIESSSLENGSAITVEGWFYVTGVQNGAYSAFLIRKGTGEHEWSLNFPSGTDENTRYLTATFSTTNVGTGDRRAISGVSLASIKNQWVHLAMTYDGTWSKLYKNGVLIAQSNHGTAMPIYNASSDYIYFLGYGLESNNSMVGNVDEVRVSNVVRTFVPPTPDNGGNTTDFNQAFDADDNTLALWHFDEAFPVPTDNYEYTSFDASANGHNVMIKNENVSFVNTFNMDTKKFGISSLNVNYQRGGRWYARVPELGNLVNGSTLTVEGWVYITGTRDTTGTYAGILMRKGSSAYHEWSMWFPASTDETQRFLRATVSTSDTSAGDRYVMTNLSLASLKNQWVHLAMTYDGNFLRVFQNGQEVAARYYTNSAPIYNTTGEYVHFLGSGEQGVNYTMLGYVDEVRLSDVVRYEGSVWELAVTPQSREVTGTTGTTTFEVSNVGTGTMPWMTEILEGSDWMTITSGANWLEGNTITVSYTGNATSSSRTGRIRVIADGAIGAPMEVTIVQAANVIPGDANNDGMVDVGDLGILAANYGGSGKTWAQGDFNNDGLVDVGDLGILAANYGTGVNTSVDFAADYAKAFGTAAEEDNSEVVDGGSLCGGLGLPLIAGLLLAGLMLVKLEE